MAYEYDELNNRRQQRQRQKKKAHQAKRRRNVRLLAFFALLLVCLLVLVIVLVRSLSQDPTLSTPSDTTQSTQPSQPLEPETVIQIAIGGDINVTDKVVSSGEQNGRYDYDSVFLDVAGIFAQADASLLNFEGNLSGAPYGTESTSAPQELMQTLASMGVDMVQLANSCTVNNGLTGLTSTLNGVRSAGLEPLGVFASSQEFRETQGFTIRNIGGLRVAFVAFTKGVGSLGLPAGSQDRVNLLYTDYSSTYKNVDVEGITDILQAIQAQKPDVTIAMLHWGSEYNNMISDSQKQIVELLQKNGVDAIVGTHPHYVQQVQFDPQLGQVVAYSLGDLFGDGEKAGTNYSIILQLQITRNNQTGETKITGCDYVPVFIAPAQAEGEQLRVLRIREAMAMYESNHISKVSQETYEAMKYALTRIESRVEGN